MANSTYPDGSEWPSKIEDRKQGSGWLEPESAANDETPPQYPYNHVTQTESGHTIEYDDTPERERIRIQHRTGTFIEMHPNGDMVHKVYGDGYEITVYDKNVLIKGHCSVTIEGDSVLTVKGNKIENIEGNYDIYVGGKMTCISKKDARILSEADLQLGAGGSMGDATGGGTGAIRLVSGRDINVTGNMMVGGSVVCDMLNSKTSVDAGTGVTAGALGFVTITGGLSVGYSAAIPSIINCVNTINAPIANFGIMTARLMTDTVNKAIYSSHIHRTPHGVSSGPISKFV
jgi:hypothetical protein